MAPAGELTNDTFRKLGFTQQLIAIRPHLRDVLQERYPPGQWRIDMFFDPLRRADLVNEVQYGDLHQDETADEIVPELMRWALREQDDANAYEEGDAGTTPLPEAGMRKGGAKRARGEGGAKRRGSGRGRGGGRRRGRGPASKKVAKEQSETEASGSPEAAALPLPPEAGSSATAQVTIPPPTVPKSPPATHGAGSPISAKLAEKKRSALASKHEEHSHPLPTPHEAAKLGAKPKRAVSPASREDSPLTDLESLSSSQKLPVWAEPKRDHTKPEVIPTEEKSTASSPLDSTPARNCSGEGHGSDTEVTAGSSPTKVPDPTAAPLPTPSTSQEDAAGTSISVERRAQPLRPTGSARYEALTEAERRAYVLDVLLPEALVALVIRTADLADALGAGADPAETYEAARQHLDTLGRENRAAEWSRRRTELNAARKLMRRRMRLPPEDLDAGERRVADGTEAYTSGSTGRVRKRVSYIGMQ